MNPIIEHLTGVQSLTDQVIAMDYLITSKSAVRNYAMAVTDAGTPEIKSILIRQLDEAIVAHERIVTFMLERGWYHPWDSKQQLQLNMQNVDIALGLPLH
ncbi:spore coat protein [Paenibacillus xylanilyticus]|uniref:spore coat protein n=1 Tax=Paenibacillus xylanilyticus TaxID=248903 RepID=UPI00399F0AE3